MTTQRERLLAVAGKAFSGQIPDILVRRDGSAVLLNAGKELMWTGYSPEAELLKGLIVRVDGSGRPTELVAGCLPKFYNWGENATNDTSFRNAMSTPGAQVQFLEKLDGSMLRPYVHPDRGVVEFATRGMLQFQSGGGGYADFCALAHSVAQSKYPALENADLVGRYTFCCELIHPSNRIVTNYGEREDLPVITIIDNSTGHELPRAQVLELCKQYRLTPVEAFSPRSRNPIDAITEMRRVWGKTDAEGMVVTVEHPEWATHFRIKVKGEHYLALFRLKNACTIRRTRELAEANNVNDWNGLRSILLREFPQLPEEVQMGYRDHFARWAAWDQAIRVKIETLIALHDQLPARDADQKTFALSIAQHPERASFFTIRKYGADKARVALLESLRKQHESELRAGIAEIPDPSLAG